MTEAPQQAPGRAWHQALIYAITGSRPDGVANRGTPDIEELDQQLRSQPGRQALLEHAHDRLGRGEPWPHPVPSDLMTGLGYAQFSAALTQLVLSLDLDAASVAARRVRGAGDEAMPSGSDGLRRLLDDVPPHHGT